MPMDSDCKVLYHFGKLFDWPTTWHGQLWRMTWHCMSRMCGLAYLTFGVDFMSMIGVDHVVDDGSRIPEWSCT